MRRTDSGVDKDVEEIENTRIARGQMGNGVGYENINPVNDHLPNDLFGDVEEPAHTKRPLRTRLGCADHEDAPYPPGASRTLSVSLVNEGGNDQHAHESLGNLPIQ